MSWKEPEDTLPLVQSRMRTVGLGSGASRAPLWPGARASRGTGDMGARPRHTRGCMENGAAMWPDARDHSYQRTFVKFHSSMPRKGPSSKAGFKDLGVGGPQGLLWTLWNFAKVLWQLYQGHQLQHLHQQQQQQHPPGQELRQGDKWKFLFDCERCGM